LEPIERVGDVIRETLEAIPAIVKYKGVGSISTATSDALDRLLTIRRAAEVSVLAIGDVDTLTKLEDVRAILQEMIEAENATEAIHQNPKLNATLAALESSYYQLKLDVIGGKVESNH